MYDIDISILLFRILLLLRSEINNIKFNFFLTRTLFPSYSFHTFSSILSYNLEIIFLKSGRTFFRARNFKNRYIEIYLHPDATLTDFIKMNVFVTNLYVQTFLLILNILLPFIVALINYLQCFSNKD